MQCQCINHVIHLLPRIIFSNTPYLPTEQGKGWFHASKVNPKQPRSNLATFSSDCGGLSRIVALVYSTLIGPSAYTVTVTHTP